MAKKTPAITGGSNTCKANEKQKFFQKYFVFIGSGDQLTIHLLSQLQFALHRRLRQIS